MNLDILGSRHPFYLFDFDGTLVKNTKFINPDTNFECFKNFKLFVNPSAFEIDWGIITNRPKIDRNLILCCLYKNNASADMVLTYDGPMPPPSKLYDIAKYKNDYLRKVVGHYNSDERINEYVYYVDNDEKMRNEMIKFGFKHSISVLEFIQLQNNYWEEKQMC